MTTTTTEQQATGPVLETATRVILHCSRCNAPFKDDDYECIVLWDRNELNKAFSGDFREWDDVQGWIRLGDRYLCFDCWEYDEEDDENEERTEKAPLPAADADKIARDQVAYRTAEVTV